ncbi:MAG: hypothetical protein CMD50_01515 [Gammaproteobacteria bacterium]|nr:hypothetical protein [Gammaproteobacteria bacterium]|tara:strand:- start:795 stop:1007 length:213 start_codon:yes stop_codon:yes gene_type:complete
MIKNAENAIRGLTSLGLSLLALGIVLGLIGNQIPFVGDIASNIVGLVRDLGNAGVVGLVAAGVILWLFRE